MPKKTLLPLFLFSLLTGLLLAGCQAGEIKAGLTENGDTIELQTGQVLVISLDSNPTTGYSWTVIHVDPAILAQQGEPEYQQTPSQETLVGAGGTETYRFKAVGTGQTILTLGYWRSFEPDVAPINTYTLQVNIQ